MRRLFTVFLLVASAFATNYTVKSGGGGSFTTMAACASQMSTNGTSVSDTCTVYAGTYNENVTVPSGSVGNYKIFNINGSDVVTVQTFVVGSHVKLIGNCPTPMGGTPPASGSCGFTLTYPSSAGSAACVEVNANTDIYVTNNVMTKCGSGGLATVGSPPGNSSNWNCGSGMIHATDGASYIFIQGNSLSYPNYNATGGFTGGTSVGIAMQIGSGDNASNSANHIVIENNDVSHYDLGVKYGSQYMLGRNNFFHDQLETEGCENQHSDEFFSEQKNNVKYNVIEGNLQRNAVGPNAKGVLSQADGPCVGCTNLIVRFNITSRIGSGVSSNYGPWPYIKNYNNTRVDLNMEGSTSSQDTDYNDSSLASVGLLNNIYYYTINSAWSNWNSGSCGSSCNAGHNLWYGTGSGFAGTANPYNHLYGGSGGTWTADPGNLKADPKFVNYVSPGSTSNNYHLQATSPAIAAGTYLTTVAAGDSGSGTTLVVSDTSYFQDGYGLTNANSTVSGDCISVTTVSNHVCITAVVDATHLTLASGISRSNGDHIWLYSKSDGVQVLTGSAPDLGAYPYQIASPACFACSLLYSKAVLP